jgi:formate dehydrogenase major subunit
MQLTRRDFLKLSGFTSSGIILSSLGLFDLLKPTKSYAQCLKIKYGKETTTICAYCAGGCGIILTSVGNKLLNSEGNPDHPINGGGLCSKGNAAYQIANNDRRMKDALYRAPGSDKWETVDFDWAVHEIAKKIKTLRDKTFIEKDDKGNIVNRLESLAIIGGSPLDNEEAYLNSKFARSLGVVHLETQARI